MVLTKGELIPSLENEVRILLHLVSKVDPAKLGYRPTAKQRSTLELLQYLGIFAPIHLRTIVSGVLNMDEWRATWQAEEAAAQTRNLEAARAAIAGHALLFKQLLGPLYDTDLRTEMDMFGSKASRGAWIVRLVLCHYAAYRMQLFLYLKASGREELSTLNLWVGVDAA